MVVISLEFNEIMYLIVLDSKQPINTVSSYPIIMTK